VRFDVRLSRSSTSYIERTPGKSSGVSSHGSTKSPKIRTDHTRSHWRAVAIGAARVGALRIIFKVDRERRVVDVSDIAPRGQVYRGL